MVGTGAVSDVLVRWATAADIDELVRLRQVMFDSMGVEVTADDLEVITAALRTGLPDGTFFAAVVDAAVIDATVVDDAIGEATYLAACGIGMTAQRVPGPGNPSGRCGYIQSMVTDDRARRQGFARAVLAALLERFEADGVTHVDLHATASGEPLYRSAGFRPGVQPELRWTAG